MLLAFSLPWSLSDYIPTRFLLTHVTGSMKVITRIFFHRLIRLPVIQNCTYTTHPVHLPQTSVLTGTPEFQHQRFQSCHRQHWVCFNVFLRWYELPHNGHEYRVNSLGANRREKYNTLGRLYAVSSQALYMFGLLRCNKQCWFAGY